MGDRKGRRPSASIVIACIALFAALSGGAFAAKNLIDSKDIENNSITSKDVKKDALKGSDVKKNSLKGSDVDESKLGEVPAAASATSADNATNADGVAGVEAVRVEPFTLTNGGSQQVLQHGAFTLTATCVINDGGTDFARVIIETSVDNAAMDAADTTEDLDVATPVAERDFATTSTPTGTPQVDQEDDGGAVAPDGTEILGQEFISTINANGDPAGTCRFGGMYFVD